MRVARRPIQEERQTVTSTVISAVIAACPRGASQDPGGKPRHGGGRDCPRFVEARLIEARLIGARLIGATTDRADRSKTEIRRSKQDHRSKLVMKAAK